MAPHRRVFWTLTLPIAGTSYVLIDKLVTAYAQKPSAQEIKDIVLPELTRMCAPEQAEQMTYVLAVVLPIVLMFAVTLLLKALGAFRRGESSQPWLGLSALAAQVAMLVVGLRALGSQASVGYQFRFLETRMVLPATIIVGLLLACTRLWSGPGPYLQALWQRLRGLAWWPWILALGWVAVFAITGLYREGELPLATQVVSFHMPFTMGEYAAVLNGRTPLVDFFSQYQNLQGLLLAPLFRLIGFGVGTYTAVMSGLTLLGLGLLFSVLGRVCGNRWTALLLFVPVTAVAFYAEQTDSLGYRTHAFNYYAVGPIRYFGPCFLAWVAIRYLTKPSPLRLIVAAALSFLVALNNLDFGVPAAVGVLACAILFPPSFAGGQLRRIVTAIMFFALVALATLGLYCVGIRLWAGDWPMLGQLVVYQRAFALLGFAMLPMPETGLHWIVYATAMAAVLIPVFETFSSHPSALADNRRLINGSLAYSGFAAFGPLTYYAGRSHDRVLEATFMWWTFILAQLLNRAWCEWRETSRHSRKTGHYLLPIPLMAVLGLFSIVSSSLSETPDPVEQVSQRFASYPSGEVARAPLLQMIGRYVRPGSATMIIYPNAHWLALLANVKNVFPFSHFGSLLIKEQINPVMAALTRLPADQQYVLGSPASELLVRLKENGFAKVDAVGDFAVWFKGPQ